MEPRTRLSALDRSRSFRITRVVVWLGALWAAYLFGLGPYVYVRSFGYDWRPWTHGIVIEQHIFGFVPTRVLQEHFYHQNGASWLDYAGFLLHLSWFIVPFACGLMLTLLERRRLFEYLAWLMTAAYVSDAFYL